MKHRKPTRKSSHSSRKFRPKINIKRKSKTSMQNFLDRQRSTKNRSSRPQNDGFSRQGPAGTKDSDSFLDKHQSEFNTRAHDPNVYHHVNHKQTNNPSKLLRNGKSDSKLRIAHPPRNPASISSTHWDQVSSRLQKPQTTTAHNRPKTMLRKNSNTENMDQSSDTFQDKQNEPTRATIHHPVQNSNFKTFSFLSNIGGNTLFTPTLYNQSVFPKKNRISHNDLKVSKMTIITDANVDHHELDIAERRIQRKNIMDLTARGVLEPKIGKEDNKVKKFRPSSSRPNLRPRHPNMMHRNMSQPKIEVVKQARRRPMSANPKFVTISGRNRPLSAQIKMGERKFDYAEESIESMDKDSDDLNIQEISEVPKFDETEEKFVKNEEKKFSDKIMKSQPTTASIFKRDKDFNLPYPELFDRTERTFAACYAKFGNLSYFTAVQRIGCYMDFAARLKRRHLNDIIQYIKHNDVQEVDDEEHDENFDENCLFTGLMTEEDPENVRMSEVFMNTKKTVQLITHQDEDGESDTEVPKPISHVYDPAGFVSEFAYPNLRAYSPALLKELEVSKLRYNHYLEDADGVRPNEISKYNKEWMSNSLNLIYPTQLLKTYTLAVKDLFQEVLDVYSQSMKRAILDYILRSPAERKRLHILMIPREIPPSSDKIAMRGGYSTKIFKDWHQAKKDAEDEVKIKMINNNIVMGSLTSWWHDFREIRLVRFDSIHAFSTASGFPLTFDNFLKLVYMFRVKTLMLLQDIWHRGAIMIIKKFKYLKRRGLSEGKWTYSGFHEQSKEDNLLEDPVTDSNMILHYIKTVEKAHNTKTRAVEDGLEFDSMLTHLHNDVEMEELIDVRENSAYVAFVQLIGGYINYEEDGYEILAKEYKRELKYAGGNLMAIQLREIVEKSVSDVVDFFTSFPEFEQFDLCFEEATELKKKTTSRRLARVIESSKVVNDNSIINPNNMQRKSTFKDTETRDYTKNGMPMSQEHKEFKTRLKERNHRRNPLQLNLSDEESEIFESELHLPIFVQNNYVMNPMIGIFLTLKEDDLDLDKTEDQIVNEVMQTIDHMINCCNDFIRPEFAKVNIISPQEFMRQEEEEAMMNKMTFSSTKKENEFEDLVFGGLDRNIYSKYFGRIKLSKSEKEQKDIIFSKEEAHIFKRSWVKKYMHVADKTEQCFVDAKLKIEQVLRAQYRACFNTYQIFDQLKPLLTTELRDKMNSFLHQESKSKSEYERIVAEIKNFRELCYQIPHSVKFPLFNVNCESVRTSLLERVEALLATFREHIEKDILVQSKHIDKRYNDIRKYMQRKLITAEDVQDMEKFTNNLILEKSVMQDKIDEWRESLFLLVDMDYSVSDHIQNLAKIIYEWPKKLEAAYDEAYKSHYDDREIIENQMMKERDLFEKEMDAFEHEIKVVETYDDLFSYPQYTIPIKSFQEKLTSMKARKDRLELEEMILLGIKSSYESYFRTEKFFDPHYSFWIVAEVFLDRKKYFKGSTASKLDIAEVSKLKTDAQNMMRKIKNKMGQNQIKLVENMRRQIKDLESCMSIIEILSNPGLKRHHWEKIKETVGADLDFRKLSIDRIKFLKIEHLLEPISEISEVASKEYSIELYLKTMDEELVKNIEKFDAVEEYTPKEIQELKHFKEMLVEQQSNIKTLRGNKNIGPLIDMLEAQATKTNQTLEQITEKYAALTA